MKSQSSIVNLIPVFIIVVGVMGLALSIPNTLLNLGDSFLSLFSVTQVFWMGVLWVCVGSLLLVWQRSPIHIRRMVALLIMGIGVVGLVMSAALGVFNGVTTSGTFDLQPMFWLGLAYVVIGGLMLVIFRSPGEAVENPVVEEAAPTPAAEPDASWKSMTAVPKNNITAKIVVPKLSEADKTAQPQAKPAPAAVQAQTTPAKADVQPQPAPAPAPARTPAPAEVRPQATPAARSPEPARQDDLTILEGIGPKAQEALYAAGVTTFAQVAHMTPEALEKIVRDSKVRMIGNAKTWPRQAQYLVDGDAVGFENYIKHLVAGRESD